MAKAAGQPQTIVSSISTSDLSTSDQITDPQCRASDHSNAKFVNQGLILWHEARRQWLRNRKPQRYTQLREPAISWNATYKSLLGPNKPFHKPIPLGEMIDFLLDIWEVEEFHD